MNASVIILAVFAGLAALVVAARLVRFLWPRQELVDETQHGLLYRDGRFIRLLEPGRHRLWRRGEAVVTVDRREVVATVPGQEVLTRDNLQLKVSLSLRYRVADPVRSLHANQDAKGLLYAAAQLALRDAVAGVDAEALLESRVALGHQVHAAITPAAERAGLELVSADLKDVMLPAELRKAFAETLRARKEGEAELERARARAAALRTLANAARLFEDHPGLLDLRVLETLDAAGRAGGNTLVLGVPEHLVRHKEGRDG